MISKIRIVGHLGRWAGLAAFMIVLACAVASCSKSSDTGTTTPGTEPTPAATTPETTPAATPATSEATPKPEATPEATPAPQADNLLKNPDLGQWANGMPVGWDKEPWDGVKVTTTTETHDGKPVAQVEASGDSAILKQAVLNSADLKPGEAITASAWVKADEKGVVLAIARINADENGQEQREYSVARHPGDGTWKKLEISWLVPQTVDPKLKKVVFQVRSDMKPAKPFMVANPSVTTAPGAPAPAESAPAPAASTPAPAESTPAPAETATPAPTPESATPVPTPESAASKPESDNTAKPAAEKSASPKKSKKRKAKTPQP